MAMLALSRAREMARETAAKDDLSSLRTALLLMENDTGKWPNGCPPWSNSNPEVDFTTAQAGLMVQPEVGDQGDGCQWLSQEVAKWDGPYVTGVTDDPWGNHYYFDADYTPYSGCPSIDDEPVAAVVVSFGPNGEGLNDYDCDDIFLKLK